MVIYIWWWPHVAEACRWIYSKVVIQPATCGAVLNTVYLYIKLPVTMTAVTVTLKHVRGCAIINSWRRFVGDTGLSFRKATCSFSDVPSKVFQTCHILCTRCKENCGKKHRDRGCSCIVHGRKGDAQTITILMSICELDQIHCAFCWERPALEARTVFIWISPESWLLSQYSLTIFTLRIDSIASGYLRQGRRNRLLMVQHFHQ
jgi:hypothetical protein